MSKNITELNSKTFDKFIKEDKVVVDFWAVWCVAPNSHVYTSPLNSKPANKISKNDDVISLNNNIATDKIIYSKTTNGLGHCKKVTTVTGRLLETTDDHAFYTQRGWIAADKLKNEDKIAVLPVSDPIEFEGGEEMILNEDNFSLLKTEYKNLNKYLAELKKKELLPLKRDNPKLSILARLVGFLFSDGSLYNSKKNNYREISFVLGQEKDVKDIISDLNSLGFEVVHTSERNNEMNFGDRKAIIHTFRVKCLSTSLYLLLKTLGVPEGNKTNQDYSVPDWIIKGEKTLKKEFLSGYLGGDGPKVRLTVMPRKNKNPYNSININDIEFHKRKDLVNSGIKFANQISTLLKDLDVNISNIFYEIDSYIRKDKTQCAIIHIKIANNLKNGFILTQKIGYSYCWQKQLNGMYVGEFLREILKRRAAWNSVYQKTLELNKKGSKYQEISRLLNISEGTVCNWIAKKIKPSIKKHNIKFDKWLEESRSNLPEGFIWEKIDKIEETYLPEVQVIETEKNHNFVANGLLVHNCGPCKMMAPIFEQASAEMKDKAKFAKVNVDDNLDLAQRFQVMSIPTTIFFRDGKQVDRVVGVISKEELVKRIKDIK